MQETFYSMIKSLHQFDGKSKLSTWLYRIVTNHCLMLARKIKSRQFVSIDDDEGLLHFLKRFFLTENAATAFYFFGTAVSNLILFSRVIAVKGLLRERFNGVFYASRQIFPP